ncbi:MAG: calcium-binding protein [Pseudomonadota bacterium]
MRLLLAGNFVLGTDLVVGGPLDGSGYGHLQLVFDQGDLLEATEIEVQGNAYALWFFGNWVVSEEDNNHSQDTGFFGQENFYTNVEIELGDRTPDHVWDILTQAREQFDNAIRGDQTGTLFQYEVTYNSNTFASTLLSIIGIDINDHIDSLITSREEDDLIPDFTFAEGIRGYPGYNRNALNDAEFPNDAIDLQFNGTDGNDIIQTGNGRDTLSGNMGNDHLSDGGIIDEEEAAVRLLDDPDSRIDVLDGGEDDDIITFADDLEADIFLVSEGFDYIEGGGVLDRIILPTELIDADSLDIGIESIPVGTFQQNEFVRESVEIEVLHRGNGRSQASEAPTANGIPLLGGFIVNPDPDASAVVAQYQGFNSPDTNGVYDEFTARVKVTTTIVNINEDGGGGGGATETVIESTLQLSAFDVTYYTLDAVQASFPEVLQTYDELEREYSAQSLFINIGFAIQSEEAADNGVPREGSWVLISDFTPGDFGIEFSLENPEDFARINNEGAFEEYRLINENLDEAPDTPSEPADPVDPGADISLQTLQTAETNMIEVAEVLSGSAADELISGGVADDILDGLGGDDVLFGGAGNDTLNGGEGDDTLFASRGQDTYDGGAGTDTLDLRYMEIGHVVDLTVGELTEQSQGALIQALASIERVIGTQDADRIIGDRNANQLFGSDGEDTLSGRGGDDIIFGGADSDTLSGGGGEDTLRGGSGDDHLTGGAGNDILIGEHGDDVLRGGSGEDALNAGFGDDRLNGGAGGDRLTGGEGIDTATYGNSDAAVAINLQTGDASGGDAEGDVLVQIENLVGTDFADNLTGNAEANRLAGRDGNDALFGLDGSDRLIGGLGNDELFGGNGNDRLFGGEGDDIIDGGSGDDRLSGNAGADRFRFSVFDFGNDTIRDYEDGLDIIDFAALGIAFSDLSISQDGEDANIQVSGNVDNFITLLDTDIALVTQSDFQFSAVE